jgi:serine/threonine protein kinase
MYNVVTGRLPFEENEKDFVGKLRSGLVLTFPEREWKYYSPEAMSFTRGLLSTKPEKRLTALAALVHPWLDDVRRFGSSRFTANGRFSRAIAGSGQILHDVDGSERRDMSAFFPMLQEKRMSWVVAFIAVKAANRFLSLVRARRATPPTVKSSTPMEELESGSEDEGSSPAESHGPSNGSMADATPRTPNGASIRSSEFQSRRRLPVAGRWPIYSSLCKEMRAPKSRRRGKMARNTESLPVGKI